MAERKETYIGNSKLKGSPEDKYKFILGKKVVKTDNIADGAITTDKIADGSITLAKMKNSEFPYKEYTDMKVAEEAAVRLQEDTKLSDRIVYTENKYEPNN